MGRKMAYLIGILTGTASLLCWLVMFAAGTDVWHDTGRPDIWNLQGPPYPDVRAFLWAYYLLFPVLLAQTAYSTIGFLLARKQERRGLPQ